ncbi:MAG TPA: biotin carboxylase N-terminal domain-containing protein, partial [Nocardioidaceae bacterium]|nr:biotin carboxylase N-terminal domain-containing protein [Nocardioidaceae bacterium]
MVTSQPLSRIAVVNRGEAAMRLIHAVRELESEPGGRRIEVIALHTEAEATARFVREADVAYDLGPASRRPYLDLAVLERALVETRADAAWVGWGFVAEDPAFAELCDRLGVVFVGPSAEAMRLLGDKIGAKLLAEEVGVPVAPWSRGPVDTLDDALAHAARIGYPLMLKASAGGGGRGIRVVTTDDELAAAYQLTRDEAERAFGSGTVFLERLVTGARHVEVQVIADGQGTAWALGVRDCSVQRRNQKVIEESSSPVLGPDDVARLKESAARLALRVGYRGAATVEFLYHPGDGTLAFLEVNTRLQVEHPITELTTGFDLVKAQLHVAAGGRLVGEPPAEQGHAIEARLNAEDPDRDFAPAPGRVELLALPDGPGIRVDTGLGEGDVIPADFDSMIAKIIAYGRDREEALGRLRRALADTHVVIEGGATNKSFLLDLLDQPEVLDGSADTGWIDRVRMTGRLVSHQHAGVALVVAGIEAYEQGEALDRQHFLATAHGGRPQARHESARTVDLKLRGATHRVTVARLAPDRFRVALDAPLDGGAVDVVVRRRDRHTMRLNVTGQDFRVLSAAHGPVHFVEVDGVTHRVNRDEGGVMRSPAPALVVASPVQVGAEVEAGAPVLVLESMKMETALLAPFPARVRELLVAVGHQVETGAPLVRLEPLQEGDAGNAASSDGAAAVRAGADESGQLPELPARPAVSASERAIGALEDLRALLLGFDLTPGEEARAVHDYRTLRGEADRAAVLASEVALIEAFTDVAELGRNKPAGMDNEDVRVHSPREYLHTYLHSLDIERERLPEGFQERLRRALGHYGVTDLERSEALEDAVFRLFLAQQSVASHLGVVSAVLQQWMSSQQPEPRRATEVHELLDHLVLASQLRYPAIGDLARSVRFRWFDQPLVEAARAEVLAGVADEVEYLAENPDAADHDERVNGLVTIPERIVRFLFARLKDGVPQREPMLEVLARRHYREHGLSGLREVEGAQRPVVVADYELDGHPTHLVTTVGRAAELVEGSDLVREIERQLDAVASGSTELVVDLYLHWPEAPHGGDAV